MTSRGVAALVMAVLIGLACVAVLEWPRSHVPPDALTTSSATPFPGPAVTIAPSPGFATSECTTATATTRQVIERYFELSTSKDPGAVTDCFATAYRSHFVKNPTWDEVAVMWASAGPAAGLTITRVDSVRGCDRFRVSAQMATYGANNGFSVTPFITIGPEAGVPRIFEMGTALVNEQSATTTCK